MELLGFVVLIYGLASTRTDQKVEDGYTFPWDSHELKVIYITN